MSPWDLVGSIEGWHSKLGQVVKGTGATLDIGDFSPFRCRTTFVDSSKRQSDKKSARARRIEKKGRLQRPGRSVLGS